MSGIEDALDRFELSANAAGYRICASSPQRFDEALAVEELRKRRIPPNEEQFAMLRRWNGPWLEKDGEVKSLTLWHTAPSFEEALQGFDSSSSLANDFPGNAEFFSGMFPVLEYIRHDYISYFNSSAENLFELYLKDEMLEFDLVFPNLAGFFKCASVSIEQGIDPTYYLSNPDTRFAGGAFAKICMSEFPEIEHWREVVDIEENGL